MHSNLSNHSYSLSHDLLSTLIGNIWISFCLFPSPEVFDLNPTLVSHGEHTGIQTEEKVVQEVVDTVVVTLPEASALKVSADPCPHPLPVPATPPKQASSLQATPQTPASEGKRKPEPPPEVIEVPKALPAEHADQRRMLVEMCVSALFLCLGRFPQHYKSLYRLAFFYTNSKSHQVSPPPQSQVHSHRILQAKSSIKPKSYTYNQCALPLLVAFAENESNNSYNFIKCHMDLLHWLFLRQVCQTCKGYLIFFSWSSLWACEFCSDTRVAETACVGYKALWAEVCVGGGAVLSQPVWHREVVLSFTVVASFCQCSVCQTILIQSLSLLNKGGLDRERT